MFLRERQIHRGHLIKCESVFDLIFEIFLIGTGLFFTALRIRHGLEKRKDQIDIRTNRLSLIALLNFPIPISQSSDEEDRYNPTPDHTRKYTAASGKTPNQTRINTSIG